MERLTRRCEYGYIPTEELISKSDFDVGTAVLDKLGKYEDVERLCEMVVKQPIYFKSLDGIVVKRFAGHNALYQFETGRVFLFDDADQYVFSLDPQYYGKAWAFEMEDFE